MPRAMLSALTTREILATHDEDDDDDDDVEKADVDKLSNGDKAPDDVTGDANVLDVPSLLKYLLKTNLNVTFMSVLLKILFLILKTPHPEVKGENFVNLN